MEPIIKDLLLQLPPGKLANHIFDKGSYNDVYLLLGQDVNDIVEGYLGDRFKPILNNTCYRCIEKDVRFLYPCPGTCWSKSPPTYHISPESFGYFLNVILTRTRIPQYVDPILYYNDKPALQNDVLRNQFKIVLKDDGVIKVSHGMLLKNITGGNLNVQPLLRYPHVLGSGFSVIETKINVQGVYKDFDNETFWRPKNVRITEHSLFKRENLNVPYVSLPEEPNDYVVKCAIMGTLSSEPDIYYLEEQDKLLRPFYEILSKHVASGKNSFERVNEELKFSLNNMN